MIARVGICAFFKLPSKINSLNFLAFSLIWNSIPHLSKELRDILEFMIFNEWKWSDLSLLRTFLYPIKDAVINATNIQRNIENTQSTELTRVCKKSLLGGDLINKLTVLQAQSIFTYNKDPMKSPWCGIIVST